MKVDSLKDVTTAQKLVVVDPTDKKMHVHCKKVEVEFQAELILKEPAGKKIICKLI